jgi:hypothetical protein
LSNYGDEFSDREEYSPTAFVDERLETDDNSFERLSLDEPTDRPAESDVSKHSDSEGREIRSTQPDLPDSSEQHQNAESSESKDSSETQPVEVLRFRRPHKFARRPDEQATIEERVFEEMSKLSELEGNQNTAPREVENLLTEAGSEEPKQLFSDDRASEFPQATGNIAQYPSDDTVISNRNSKQAPPSLTIGTITINADSAPTPQKTAGKKEQSPDIAGQLRRAGLQRL